MPNRLQFLVKESGFCPDARPAHTGASLSAPPYQIHGTYTPMCCAGRAARLGAPPGGCEGLGAGCGREIFQPPFWAENTGNPWCRRPTRTDGRPLAPALATVAAHRAGRTHPDGDLTRRTPRRMSQIKRTGVKSPQGLRKILSCYRPPHPLPNKLTWRVEDDRWRGGSPVVATVTAL